MMATERLRELLDDRGVKWTDRGYVNYIWWKGFDGVRWYAENIHCVDGWRVKVEAVITPEQAIAATLGAVTCRNIDDDYDSYFECSECGCHVLCDFYGSGYGKPRFCPGCGRKVE